MVLKNGVEQVNSNLIMVNMFPPFNRFGFLDGEESDFLF